MSYESTKYYFANPKIHLFPRSLKYLLKEEKKTENGTEKTEKQCELNEILTTYKDDNAYCFAGKYFKEIEKRVYLDLNTYNSTNNEYTVIKKLCVGFLAKQGDTYKFTDKQAVFCSIELKCEVSDSNITAYLKYDDIDNSSNPQTPISLNLNNIENRIKELSLIIKYSADAILPAKSDLKIYAKHANSNDWKETYIFKLYRNTENSLDGFKQSSGQDTDFFVLPRVNPSENQKKCIKQLQIINNQVFARNASLTNFEFVTEDGTILQTITNNGTTTTIKTGEIMAENARNALKAFEYDSESDTGCKSGSKIGKLETHYSYNFSNFGQQKDLINYLCYEYFINTDTLEGRIYDRNFLFGKYKDGDPDNKIEGIVNLYKLVVVPFIGNLTEQINLFHNFNHEWLSCPRYNKNYKRGPLTITNNMAKYLYSNSQNIINLSNIGYTSSQDNKLPTGTIVTFKKGKDEQAFSATGENFYEIESVTIQGTRYPSTGAFNNYTIKLSLADKKLCNDKQENSNKGNYNDTSYDYGNYGIPYYMNGMDDDDVNNDQCAKLTKTKLLNWNESKDNWYSYKDKPNTGSFGIDCSGLVINSITGIASNKNHYFTVSDLDINALTIGQTYCRKLPITTNYDSNSFLTKNDIVFSRTHIAFCSDGNIKNNFINDYVLKNQLDYTNRQFNICHNYGMEHITTQTGQIDNLYSKKTISGPFRHWNAEIQDAPLTDQTPLLKTNISRIYIWSKSN